MRKLPSNLENPIDDLLIHVCEPLNKVLRKLYLNPNDITTLSLIFGFLSIVYLYKGNGVLAATFYFISYMFDCADGLYARKYMMCTKFGDLYDHIKDWTVNILFIYILVIRNKHKVSKREIIILTVYFVILFIAQAVYFGAQEVYYGHSEKSPSLSWLGSYIKTKEDAINILKYTRYLGCGTFILSLVVLTLYLEYKK